MMKHVVRILFNNGIWINADHPTREAALTTIDIIKRGVVGESGLIFINSKDVSFCYYCETYSGS